MPPDLLDVEERLRETEKEIIEYRGTQKRLVEDVSSILKKIDVIVTATGKLGQLDSIERSATAAHVRIDKFEKMKVEHEMCQETREKEMSSITLVTKDVDLMKEQMKLVSKREDDTKGFWTRRLEKFVDTAVPVVLTVLAILVAMHFNGTSWTNEKLVTATDGNKDVITSQTETIKQLNETIKQLRLERASTPVPYQPKAE